MNWGKLIESILGLFSKNNKPSTVVEKPKEVSQESNNEAAFNAAVELILKHEGGYVNHPSDPGGETNWGISKRAYPNLDIRNLTREQAIEIYRTDYWLKCKCDQLPCGIALSVFDFAVNAGVSRAIRTLQRILYVTVDGIIGPVTIGKANRTDSSAIYAYASERMAFYKSLKTFETFGRGWTRRTEETLQEALKL